MATSKRTTSRKTTGKRTSRKPVKLSVVIARHADKRGIDPTVAGKAIRSRLRRNFDDSNKRFNYPGDAKPERNDKRPWPDVPVAYAKELLS